MEYDRGTADNFATVFLPLVMIVKAPNYPHKTIFEFAANNSTQCSKIPQTCFKTSVPHSTQHPIPGSQIQTQLKTGFF